MKDYIYYPGCSLKGNSKHYEESILPVFKELGFPLEELEDWNCCGATAYFSMDDLMATAICGRNLSLAEKKTKGYYRSLCRLLSHPEKSQQSSSK